MSTLSLTPGGALGHARYWPHGPAQTEGGQSYSLWHYIPLSLVRGDGVGVGR